MLPVDDVERILETDIALLWPPTRDSEPSPEIAEKAFQVIVYTAYQKFAEIGMQMKKRGRSCFGPEGKILQKIASLFPKIPVKEDSFCVAIKEGILTERQIPEKEKIFSQSLEFAWKDLFEPMAFQYLQKVVGHSHSAAVLRLEDPDFFRRLPGRPEDAVRTACKLHQRIKASDELKKDPVIGSLLYSFEENLKAFLDMKMAEIFVLSGIRARPESTQDDAPAASSI
jgi:hypothetical protein